MYLQASLPWERWPNPVFGERGIGHSASSDRLSAWSSPPRREGVLSRLCSHTLRTSLAERPMHLRTLRGLTRGQSCYSGLGSSPGAHLLYLPPVTPSYEAEENHKTSVWSLAFMLSLLSIFNVWLVVPWWALSVNCHQSCSPPPRSDLATQMRFSSSSRGSLGAVNTPKPPASLKDASTAKDTISADTAVERDEPPSLSTSSHHTSVINHLILTLPSDGISLFDLTPAVSLCCQPSSYLIMG